MTEEELVTHITSFIEVHYNMEGTVPPLKRLLEKIENFNEAKLRQLLLTKVNPKLKARGVPQYDLADTPILAFKKPEEPTFSFKKEEDYDPNFVLACNVILDPSDTRTFNAKIKYLKPLGVTSNTWNTWMQDQRYYAYARRVFYERFDKTLDMQADMALARNIQGGDLQSIKYYKELTGKFVQKDQNQVALGSLIQVFMEIIAKHIPHGVIDVVAEELENSPVSQLFQLEANSPKRE